MSSSKIIVGVDGSEQSIRAVRWCVAHAAQLDAEVVAVHVIDAPVYIADTELPIPPLSPAQRAELEELVTREWCKPLADGAVPYRVVLMDGSPAYAIMRAAKTEDAALVVAGRRGLGGFKELLLGSTTNKLTHHLDRPLVIVP